MEEHTTPKRTYQKHKTDKKVSVVHFLNKKVKAKLIDDIPSYPLYFRLNYNRTNTTLKSVVLGYFNENSLNDVVTKILIKSESQFLSTCYQLLKSSTSDFGFPQFNKFYKQFSEIILDAYEPMGLKTAMKNSAFLWEDDTELKELILKHHIKRIKNSDNIQDFNGYILSCLMKFEELLKDPEILPFDQEKFLKLLSKVMQSLKAEIIQ